MRKLFPLILTIFFIACGTGKKMAFKQRAPFVPKQEARLGTDKIRLYTTGDEDGRIGVQILDVPETGTHRPYHIRWWTRERTWVDTLQKGEGSFLSPAKGVRIGDTVVIRAVNSKGDTALLQGIL